MDNIKDDRLHNLIGHFIQEFRGTGIKYKWTFEELIPSQKHRSDVYEIGDLCKKLAHYSIVHLTHDGGFDLGADELRNAREAYSSKKFKENTNWGNVINYVLGGLNIVILIYSSVIAYSTDDKVDTVTTTVESLIKNLEKKQVTLDSLKEEYVLSRQRTDSLINELKVKK